LACWELITFASNSAAGLPPKKYLVVVNLQKSR
jgi:hypothetical protein